MQIDKILLFTLMIFTVGMEAYRITPVLSIEYPGDQSNGPEIQYHTGNSSQHIYFPSPLIFLISPVILHQQYDANGTIKEPGKIEQALYSSHE